MTTPNRQPEGIPVGGQFAPSAHAESGIALAAPSPKAPPAVTATVILQRWREDDGIDNIGQVDFDAGRILAALTSEDRAALTDYDSRSDEIFHAAVRRGQLPEHDGPFEVRVRDAIDEAEQADPDVFAKLAALPDNRPAAAVLHEPLTAYEIGARADEDGQIEGLATFEMSELIDGDLDAHGEQIGQKLAGSELLMDVSAVPVSVTPEGSIICRLNGDASAIIDSFDEDELAQFEAGQAEQAGANR